MVAKLGFGDLPIQRTTTDEAARILQRAYAAGVRFFDTARKDGEHCVDHAWSQPPLAMRAREVENLLGRIEYGVYA